MARRTKIIATIGPACDSEGMIKDLAEAGADVFRINLSHGTLELAVERYRRVRAVETSLARPIGLLVDLPGPKIRAGVMGDAGVMLDDGGTVRLVPGDGPSTSEVVTVDHDALLNDLHVGDRVTFGDGAVMAEVVDRTGDALIATISHGGLLQGRPGVHIPSERLRLATPTDQDLRLLDAFVELGVDMVALSFVRSAHDVRRVGTEPHPRGPMIVAKVETRAAVENLDGIIEASGAVMVAAATSAPSAASRRCPTSRSGSSNGASPSVGRRSPQPRCSSRWSTPRHRPGRRPPTSPTPSSTARARSCSPARRPSAGTRSTAWPPWPGWQRGPTRSSTSTPGPVACNASRASCGRASTTS
ncbi:MAG: pyruvate kinase [Acidimicrobiales bacterium]